MAARTADELRRLASPEFSGILASDSVLTELEHAKYDKRAECALLMEVLGLGDWRIGMLPVRPLTPAKWSFLWLLDSPLTIGGDMAPVDLDVALYILTVPDLAGIPCALHGIPALASGYHAATGLDFDAAYGEVLALKRTAFMPLEMLPPDTASGTDCTPRYDADWITRIAGVAARESGESLRSVMADMTLSTVCALYVNWRRREDISGSQIRRYPSAELQARIAARIEQLEDDFLRGQ